MGFLGGGGTPGAITATSTDTLTNKLISDALICDPDDNTKRVSFDCYSISSNATRQVTFPDASITVVGTTTTQTLTNKSIDADTNTITDIANASIKAAAAIALDKLAATTASRALASDASGFVSASSVTSTELGYLSGVTSGIQAQLDALGGGTTVKDIATFKPADNEPPASNFATINVRNSRPCLEFDTTTQEAAVFFGRCPRYYAGGDIIVELLWAAATATSGTIGWDVTFERDHASGDDFDSDGFATAQTVSAATVSGTSGIASRTSVTITAGSTGTDSLAAGDFFRLRVRRDVSNDTATGDAQLFGVEVREA